MPKTALTAKFIRLPVEGGRLHVAPAFDDFLDVRKMAVLELGMQKGNLDPEQGFFDGGKSRELIRQMNDFNEVCRKAGIPIVHIGHAYRSGGLDLRNAQYVRITPLSRKKPFPNVAMEAGSPLCEFATEVAQNDYSGTSGGTRACHSGTLGRRFWQQMRFHH